MTLDFFNSRATVRQYSADRHVSDALLDALIEAAAHAPSTGNMQLYKVIITAESKQKEKLTELHLGQPAAMNADFLLTFCADVRRFGQWCSERNTVSGLNNAGGKITAIIDTAIFAQQFVTAAEQCGVGCCYLGTVMYNITGFCEALDIPEGVIPLFSVALGYPDDKVDTTISDRLPLEAVACRERYHDATTDDINRYYAAKEQLDESRRFITQNGKQTLAQVYAEVRYPRSLNETIGIDFLRLLNQ